MSFPPAIITALKATLDAVADAVMVVGISGHVRVLNNAFLAMWHVTEDLVDQPRDEVLKAVASRFADPEAFLARSREIAAISEDSTVDELHTLDGRTIERCTAAKRIDGQIVGRVWTFRDMTEQKRIEAALREETQVLEIMHRTAMDIGSRLELQPLVQAITDAGTQLSGAQFGAFFYNVTDQNGGSYLLYTLSGAPREAFEKFGQPRATPLFGPTFSGEPCIRSDDILKDPRYGQWAPHHGMPPGHLPVRSYLATPVTSRSGEVIGGLFFGHSSPGQFSARSERLVVNLATQAALAIDNARLYEQAQMASEERREALERERAARGLAEQMGHLKDDFLATLSHELRTPINAIMGWLHLLRQDGAHRVDLHKALDVLERNTKQQVKLIENLLDMNRVASGKVHLDIQPVDLAQLVESAVDTIRPAADAKGVRLMKILDSTIATIPVDPARWQQIMTNLLSNAVKFTPLGGTVQVMMARVNSHVEISVSDTGIGIEPSFLPHVFERFRQADASTTRAYGGLGLGLAIVKSLVELHGGTIRAESAGEGKGAAFHINLPVPLFRQYGESTDRQHPTASGTPATPFSAVDLSEYTLLVVDDDLDGREFAARILQSCGARTLVAANAEEALDQVRMYRPDLILSDIGMPSIDGFELLRRIRALGPQNGGALRAVALTAFARTEDRTKALNVGFDAHLAKPADPTEMVTLVAAVLRRS